MSGTFMNRAAAADQALMRAEFKRLEFKYQDSRELQDKQCDVYAWFEENPTPGARLEGFCESQYCWLMEHVVAKFESNVAGFYASAPVLEFCNGLYAHIYDRNLDSPFLEVVERFISFLEDVNEFQ